ncbi:hypothetical protein QQS21_001312 [Conoideocrella luteorostrata]|uniref:FAD-binding domain-containing protein n=1 Tax=Conoideocrella luteorostrata TaxID=1105319 RepID=A0AAJ0D017_9HYPO|nr:hypothetical protein QQS21_001312 [Conoideocrella luteorostrata]
MRKAIIIGGGPAGISAALRLQQMTDICSTIYELRAEPTTLGGAVGIFSNGLRLFHRLGLYEELAARGSSESTMTLHSLNGGIITSRDLVGAVKEQNGGFGYLRIKRPELLEVLMTAAKEAQIPIHFNKNLVNITETSSSVKVTFSDGSTDEADILFGCDGIHSAVRKLYVDPSQTPGYTGFAGIGAIITRPESIKSSANDLKGINATLTTEGGIGVMSCSVEGDQLFWGVSKEVPLPASGDSRDGWEVKREKEVADFKNNLLELLKNARGEWGVVLRSIVNETTAVKFYPTFELPSGGKWHKGRCLLLGDAAHAMSPHAGQGLSQAVEDVFMISRLLADPSRPLENVFTTYDAVRRPRVNEITKLAASNSDVRRKTNEWGLWFKELVIWIYFAGSRLIGYKTGRAMERQLLYDVDEAEV